MGRLKQKTFTILVSISDIISSVGLIMILMSLVFNEIILAKLGFICVIITAIIVTILSNDVEKSNGKGE